MDNNPVFFKIKIIKFSLLFYYKFEKIKLFPKTRFNIQNFSLQVSDKIFNSK